MRAQEKAHKAHLDLLSQLESAGVPVPASAVDLLVSSGNKIESIVNDDKVIIEDTRYHLWLYEHQRKDNLRKTGNDFPCYYDRIPVEWKKKWKEVEITKKDWAPKSLVKHTPEFRRFINSHMPRFCDIEAYEPFYLYCEQARRWNEEAKEITDFTSVDEMSLFGDEELERMKTNTLYGMDRHVWIKEPEAPGGKRKYKASTPQAFLLYILDCLYSGYLGKGRQAAITSTVAPAAMLQALLTANANFVFAADDFEKTGKAIFDGKIRFPLKSLPEWMHPERIPHKATDNLMLDFDPGAGAMDKGKLTAQFTLVAATATAINGTTPTKVFLDEATDMSEFDKIVMEINPTQLRLDEVTGQLEVARQLLAWSTGTSSGKGKGKFEGAFKDLIDRWKMGKSTDSYIPMFFDKTCRPGWTKEFDAGRRDFYMSGQAEGTGSMSTEERSAMYRAHYPSDPEDMFMATHNTLVPLRMIHGAMDAINGLPHEIRPIPGRFEPIFDTSKKMPDGSFLPYKVVGSNFIPAHEDEIDPPAVMFLPPDNRWRWRYYQGTDPLILDDGKSKMASVIWDAVGVDKDGMYHPTISCIVNTRTNRSEDSFLQMALMGIHYRNHGESACPDLVEVNAGKGYMDFKQDPFMDLRGSLVYRMQLPDVLQHGTQTYGIYNSSKSKQDILGHLKNMIHLHKDRIFFREFWMQLRTLEVEVMSNGQQRWGTIDSRRYNDDVVLASAFAYINRTAHAGRYQPELVSADNPRYKMVKATRRDPHTLATYTEMKKVLI